MSKKPPVTIDVWNPQQYEKFKAQRSQPFFDLMNLVQVTANATVIDLGCGTGELTRILHEHLQAKRTMGLDSSAQMLEKASKFASESLSYTNADIETWKASEPFDLVFSNAAIQWCRNHKSIFENIASSLKPNGQLAIQMPMNHDYPTHTIAAQMSKEQKWKDLLGEDYAKEDSMLTVEQYASLLFKLGFREQNVTLKVYGHELESREGVIEWVRGTLLTYFESRLSPADYQSFVEEFRERLFAQLPDRRPFFYPFKRVLIWARR